MLPLLLPCGHNHFTLSVMVGLISQKLPFDHYHSSSSSSSVIIQIAYIPLLAFFFPRKKAAILTAGTYIVK
ncbi:hypothetical protein DERF_000584 [Dermatophagoides farinae]|uniref:Uncharacterized protein n=1 Tax=Dermatophagoides farinae TaxID=6954 RepID=A0A922I909_DERFA|nr:hypothetical protein DERF_000584 [Dermatophagoides farinae]